jgi:uncharacterized membrane protein
MGNALIALGAILFILPILILLIICFVAVVGVPVSIFLFVLLAIFAASAAG